MTKLRPLHWKEIEKVILRCGCEFIKQEGSHRKYWRDDFTRPIILPVYKIVPKFIILQIIRMLKISKEEFYKIIRNK